MKNNQLSAFYIEQEQMKLAKVINAFNRVAIDYKNDQKYWQIYGFLQGKLAMLEEMKGLFEL